ncbi:MAG: hypothetical protein OXN95_08545 [bacterium]|nr:hypothetical protein [bacterium]MDE2935549.1 hypothetical protein [Chloroflexota bacterium]
MRAAIDAIEFLEQRGFIYSESPTSDVFRLTREGWIYGRRLIDPEYEPPTKSNDGLSVEAEELLKEAVSTGLDICWAQYIGPVNEHIEVGSKVISTPGDDESTAFYVGGINDLVANGYARREDPSGRRFVLTSAGWQLGRRLSGIQ